ncbi:unnamed protein product [Peronospora belbahrii]|uniref:Uncharacterized protein n=1 Tax=Peronospora belbahrii TaxID=622444 RepID=A0ABN8CZ96_9STRA|nr:unnamed protein product [Peronospora belbahrii]
MELDFEDDVDQLSLEKLLDQRFDCSCKMKIVMDKESVVSRVRLSNVMLDSRMNDTRSEFQARVQGDAPVYNPSVGRWLSMNGNTPELAYRNSLDTVNTASVEGALMYVQAEGINVNEQSVNLAYYANHISPTYSEFVAMDGGKCTNEGPDIPLACKVYYGLDGTSNVGRSVGASYRTGDRRAPYPDCLWFSFPNSCAQKYRTEKMDECRNQYPPGLCPLGVQPDGDACTFSYKILGFINIDDLVGITSMGYRNYYEFCSNGGVEFKAINTPNGF